MDSKDVGMEALTLTCVQYDFFHKYLDKESYTRPSKLKSDSPLNLLIRMSEDERFDKIKNPSLDSLEPFFGEHEDLIMEYWNAWEIDDAREQFQLSQEAAVALFQTVRSGTHSYNFFIVHLLTTSHAIRIILPFFPAEHHVPLVRAWWLLAIAVFIVKGRPRPDLNNVDSDLEGNTWKHVEYQALNSQYAKDAHYVKGKQKSAGS